MFLVLAGQPRNDVLEYTQGADDRAVDAPEEQGKHHQQKDDAHIQRQHGREKLYPGQPPEPQVQRARDVEKQQSDEDEADSCSDYSDFS